MKRLFYYLSFVVSFLLIVVIASLLDEVASFSKDLLVYYDLIEEAESQNEASTISILLSFIKFLLLIYMLRILNPFRKHLKQLDIHNLFDISSAKVFSKVGKGFIIYSIIKFFITWFEKGYEGYFLLLAEKNQDDTLIKVFFEGLIIAMDNRIPLLIMGLFLLIISGIIERGYVLKQENDLTI